MYAQCDGFCCSPGISVGAATCRTPRDGTGRARGGGGGGCPQRPAGQPCGPRFGGERRREDGGICLPYINPDDPASCSYDASTAGGEGADLQAQARLCDTPFADYYGNGYGSGGASSAGGAAGAPSNSASLAASLAGAAPGDAGAAEESSPGSSSDGSSLGPATSAALALTGLLIGGKMLHSAWINR